MYKLGRNRVYWYGAKRGCSRVYEKDNKTVSVNVPKLILFNIN